MPAIHLIRNPGARLVIARCERDGEVLVLVDADQPWRRIHNLARPLLPRNERRALLRALLAH
jgi:hypothetical protein